VVCRDEADLQNVNFQIEVVHFSLFPVFRLIFRYFHYQLKFKKHTKTNFNVTFYSDEDLTQVIGTATVEGPSEDTLGLQGCAVHYMLASVIWSNLPVGNHRFWAKIDPLDQINESIETDNITSGEVLVLPALLYFPAVNRN
jgi:hypothetical protein